MTSSSPPSSIWSYLYSGRIQIMDTFRGTFFHDTFMSHFATTVSSSEWKLTLGH